MDPSELQAAKADERMAFADLLDSLSDEQLAAPSLCGEWDVKTVGGHISFAIRPNQRQFFLSLGKHFGSFDKANDAMAKRSAARPIGEITASIRANAHSRFAAPVVGPLAPLADILIHSGDVRRPLGLPHDPPVTSVRVALDFLTTGRTIAFTSRKVLDGLLLKASDLDFTAGDGQLVEGRGIDLVMAVCGRIAALADLRGPGLKLLTSRLA